MTDRTFTLDEANQLLPVLESLLRRAMQSRKTAAEIEKEFVDLGHRIFLSGGLHVNLGERMRRKNLREQAIQQLKDSIDEIHATGVQVKDIDIGLLDFPCVVGDETVLLCWKYGEPHNIAYWHGMTEGFAGRKPISMLKLGPGTNLPH